MLRKSSVRNIEFWALPEWRCLLIILLLPWHPAKTSKKLPFKSKYCSKSILDSPQQNLKPNPDKILWGDWRMSPIASYRGIGNSILSTDSPLQSTNQVRSEWNCLVKWKTSEVSSMYYSSCLPLNQIRPDIQTGQCDPVKKWIN